MTRGDGDGISVWSGLVCLIFLAAPMNSTSSPNCRSLIDSLRERLPAPPTPTCLPTHSGRSGGTEFSVLPAFIVLPDFGRLGYFPFIFIVLPFFLQVTFIGPPKRISLAISSHCHLSYPPVRSVSCDSTCTILDTGRHRHGENKKQEGSRQQQQQRTAKRRHTARQNRALGSFGVVFSPLTFFFGLLFSIFFPSLYPCCYSRTFFTHHHRYHLLGDRGGWAPRATAACWGHTDDPGSSKHSDRKGICRYLTKCTMGMSDDATRMYS